MQQGQQAQQAQQAPPMPPPIGQAPSFGSGSYPPPAVGAPGAPYDAGQGANAPVLTHSGSGQYMPPPQGGPAPPPPPGHGHGAPPPPQQPQVGAAPLFVGAGNGLLHTACQSARQADTLPPHTPHTPCRAATTSLPPSSSTASSTRITRWVWVAAACGTAHPALGGWAACVARPDASHRMSSSCWNGPTLVATLPGH